MAKESARKDGSYIAVSESPDVCKTPPNDAPVPYNIVASLDKALSVSPNVKYRGGPVILADESTIEKVQGDESGSSGGLSSGTCGGEVSFVEGAGTVKANGKRIVGHLHKVRMNKGNTVGVVHCMAPPSKKKKKSDPPLKDPRKTSEIVTHVYTVQATAMIQLDMIPGPIKLPKGAITIIDPLHGLLYTPNIEMPSIGYYEGDGINRKFDDSDCIDNNSSRINVILQIIISIKDGKTIKIESKLLSEEVSPSRLIKPFKDIIKNTLILLKSDHLDHTKAAVSVSMNAKNSLAPKAPPIRISFVVKFSPTGKYLGMKGTLSGYPWIQIRCIFLERLIDNIKSIPKNKINVFLLYTSVKFQSGYWVS